MYELLAFNVCSMPTRSIWFVGLLGLSILSGCGRSTPGIGVSGTINFDDGQPVDHGMIEFEALENSVTARSSAPIVRGEYSIPPTERLVPGKYRVRVYQSGEPVAIAGPPGSDKATPVKDLISDKYNLHSQLQAEITDATEYTFDFQVERSR